MPLTTTKVFRFALLLLLLHGVLYSQNNKAVIDSIEKHIELSNNFREAYRFKESIDQASKAIALADKIDHAYYKAVGYSRMGVNYFVVEKYDDAKLNYNKSLEQLKQTDSLFYAGWMYNNLANVYADGFNDIDSALVYYQKSINIAKKLKRSDDILNPTINTGWTLIDTGMTDKAYPYLKEAREIIDTIDDPTAVVQIDYLYGKYHLLRKEYAQANFFLKRAIKQGEALEMLGELSAAYLAQSQLYAQTSRSELAYKALMTHKEYDDKVFNMNNLNQIEKIKAQFDIEEYQRQLADARREKAYQKSLAEKNKVITTVAIITSLVFLVLLLNIYNSYKSKNRFTKVLQQKNSELEVAKNEAEKLSQIKSQFISTVSHELRTPMYGVVGLTSLLLENNSMDEKDRGYLNSLKFSGDYLLNLVNDILQISKIESNKMSLHQTTVNIRDLIDNMVSSLNYQVKYQNNRMHVEVDNRVPRLLKLDSMRFSQIVINLLGNSAKFTHDGNIWLRVRVKSMDKNRAVIGFKVEDDGPGIPEDKQNTIFEDFTQAVQNKEGTKYQGTGLGLPIVKKLVELFGSTIHLNSTVGEGTSFYFELDLEISHDDNDQDVKEFRNGIDASDKHILIVEDNKVSQIVTRNTLEREQFNCTTVVNGEEAVNAMKQQTFDLVLMDLHMPNMDGFQATRAIREFNTHTPIVALTATAQEQIREKTMKSGMNDVVIKPFDTYKFYKTVFDNLQPPKSVSA